MSLKTDYKNDILDTSVNEERTYNLVDANGNIVYEGVKLRETTVFTQEGDSFGAGDINATNGMVNKLNNDLIANSNKFEAAYQDGKYGFIINDTFYEIGGGRMKVFKGTSTIAGAANSSSTVDISRLNLTSADDYYVILDTNGASHYIEGAYIGFGGGLILSASTATSFTVTKVLATGNNITFSYQVVYNV